MERQRNKQVCLLMWVLVAGLFSHNMVIAVTSTGLGEQKNYYPAPDPHAGTPPSGFTLFEKLYSAVGSYQLSDVFLFLLL